MWSQQINRKWELKEHSCRGLVECASRVCDAHEGMCVHISFPLAHSSRCVFIHVSKAKGIQPGQSLFATVEAPDQSFTCLHTIRPVVRSGD